MTLVATTHLSGLRPLGVGSQQVIDGYPQLIRVIESRLGPRDASLLARPERRPDPSWIDWHSTYRGPVTSLAQLPAERRAAVELEVGQALSRLRSLAESLRSGDGSARFFGEVLTRVAIIPGSDSIYLVGDHPVLVLWGFEAERRVPAFVPPAPPAEVPPGPIGPAAAVPPPAAATELSALGATSAATRGGWLAALWRWLLLLLLLAVMILLLLKACQPLPPVVVDRQGPPPDISNDIAQAQKDSDHLSDELKSLQALQERQLAMCIIPPPEPTPPPTVPAETTPPPPATPPPPKIVEAPKLPVVPTLPPLPAIPKAPQIAQAPPPTTTPSTTTAKPQSCQPQRRPDDAPEVVMVVDGSGSMGEPMAGAPSRLDAAKRSIGQFVDGLPNDVDVALIEFGACNRINRDNFYSPPQRPILKQRVNGLQPMAGTPLGLSVERAGRIISSVRPGIIVVVSDGNDTCGGDPCAAARAIAASKPNVKINVIDIGGEPVDAAQCMAQSTGGHVYHPGTVPEMEQAIRQASGEPDVRQCQ